MRGEQRRWEEGDNFDNGDEEGEEKRIKDQGKRIKDQVSKIKDQGSRGSEIGKCSQQE